jgi:hypothetical protein
VSATIGRDHVKDLVVADSYPSAIQFDFVVVADHATFGRTTIRVMAAGAAVCLLEVFIEITMPLFVTDSMIPVLGGCV